MLIGLIYPLKKSTQLGLRRLFLTTCTRTLFLVFRVRMEFRPEVDSQHMCLLNYITVNVLTMTCALCELKLAYISVQSDQESLHCPIEDTMGPRLLTECPQRKLRSAFSTQSGQQCHHCPHEDTIGPWLLIECAAQKPRFMLQYRAA